MTRQAIQWLDLVLSDETVVNDMQAVLRGIPDGRIELDKGWITLPEDPDIHIVTKMFFIDYFREALRYLYKAQVAIGKVNENSDRTLGAVYCFAMLWYTDEAERLTVDFHKEMR